MRARLGLLVPVARSPGWSVRCRSFTALGRASDVPALLSEASCVGKKVQRFGSVVRQREAVSDSATCARQQSVSCPLVPASTSTFQGECCGGAKERCLQWMECAGVVISRPCRVSRCFAHDLYSLLVACARNMCRRIQYSRNIYTNDHYHERYHVKRASLQALQQYWARFVCNITR